MKTKFIRSALRSLSILGLIALASCQNGGSATRGAVARGNCPGGGGSGGHFGHRSSSAQMACPDCTNKVESMFKGLDITIHSCKSCPGFVCNCIRR